MIFLHILCSFIFVVSVTNTEESVIGEYFSGIQNLFGDLIDGEKADDDQLLYSDVFINKNETFDQTIVLLIDITDFVIKHVRIFNIGRQLAAVNNYTTIVDRHGRKKIEVKFSVKELEQPRLLIELYGNGSPILLPTYLFLLIPNILFNLF